jgi:hypothetical protein
MLGYGKTIVVTDIGSFQEYPDEFVKKVRCDYHESADILRILLQMISDYSMIEKKEENILKWAKERFEMSVVVKQYIDCFKGQHEHRQDINTYVEDKVDELFRYYPYSERTAKRI